MLTIIDKLCRGVAMFLGTLVLLFLGVSALLALVALWLLQIASIGVCDE